jgi:hypothetical protein
MYQPSKFRISSIWDQTVTQELNFYLRMIERRIQVGHHKNHSSFSWMKTLLLIWKASNLWTNLLIKPGKVLRHLKNSQKLERTSLSKDPRHSWGIEFKGRSYRGCRQCKKSKWKCRIKNYSRDSLKLTRRVQKWTDLQLLWTNFLLHDNLSTVKEEILKVVFMIWIKEILKLGVKE